MISAITLSLALGTVGVPTSNTDQSISAAERRLLSVVLIAPQGSMQVTSHTQLFETLARVTRDHTDLVPTEVPGSISCMDRLQGRDRLACLTMLTRADKRPRLSRFLLIVSVLPSEGEDRLSALLLDAEVAGETIAEISAESGQSLDTAILRRAIVARGDAVLARDHGEVDGFIDKLFREDLRSVLDAAGHFGELGAITIDSPVAGLEITVDGNLMPGVSRDGPTKIVELQPGARRVALRGPKIVTVETTLDVRRAGVAEWRPDVIERSNTANSIVFWSGVSATAIGVGLIVFAQSSGSPDRIRCFAPEGVGCPNVSNSLRVFGTDPSNSGAVSIGAVALGLVSMGLTAALGNWFWGEEGRTPWPEIALGISAGAVGFGTTHIIDRSIARSNADAIPGG